MSSNLRTLCAVLGAGKRVSFLILTGKHNVEFNCCCWSCFGGISLQTFSTLYYSMI